MDNGSLLEMQGPGAPISIGTAAGNLGTLNIQNGGQVTGNDLGGFEFGSNGGTAIITIQQGGPFDHSATPGGGVMYM